jgi:hypothetical protein
LQIRDNFLGFFACRTHFLKRKGLFEAARKNFSHGALKSWTCQAFWGF